MLDKKTIAKEWIYLLICLFVGFFVIPLILLMINDDIGNIGQLYRELLNPKKDDLFIVCAIVFGPYFVFQLIRSIVWAIKQLRS